MIEAGWESALFASLPAWALLTTLFLGALASLDDTALAQTWLGQPLPAAVVAGYVLGEPAAGLALGLPLQLATLGNLPVGRSFLGEQAAPLVGALAAAAASGFLTAAADEAVLRPGPVSARVGWLLVLLAVASLAGHRLVKAERAWHERQSAGALRALRDGRSGHLDLVHLRCLLGTAVRGALVASLVYAVAVLVWIPAYPDLPSRLQKALGLLPWFSPALALGALMDLYGSRAGRRWLAGAFAVVLAALWWTVTRRAGS